MSSRFIHAVIVVTSVVLNGRGALWKEQGWAEPVFSQSFDPDRTVLSLPLTKSDDKRVTIKYDGKKVPIKSAAQREMIVEFLTDRAAGSVAELSELLGVSTSRVKKLIYELMEDDIVVADGGNRNRTYRLKA